MRERHSLDVGLLIAAALLVACGILFIYDASFVRAGQMRFTGFDPQFFLKRQALWAGVGGVAMLIAMNVPYWKLRYVAVAGMAVAILCLVAVHTPLGIESHGARRWLGHGMARFQPSELAKLALVLFLAQWLAVHQRRVRRPAEGFAKPACLIGGIGLLVAKEPDLGTALVIMLTGAVMLFLGGARKRHLALMGGLGVLAVAVLIRIEPYRGERIRAWVDPMHDVQGTGYQVVHSLIALGSGGPLGVGLGQGRQKYFYLPAEYTDYIMGTIGEELGLLGTLALLALFFFVAVRGYSIAHRTRDPLGALLAGGVTTAITVQGLLNIAVATNSVPATGVPLPFISYGGSSLVLAMIAMGLLVNVSQYPSGPPQAEREGKDTDESTVDRRWDRRARVSGARSS